MDMVALPFYTHHKDIQKPFTKQYVHNPRTIGEHIRKKRIEAGLLQKDVAVILDTCEDTITGWESGRNIPMISHYPKILSFLNYYPFPHSLDTASGLIERCRHLLGLSYERLGTLVGVHGSTLICWKREEQIAQSQCEETLLRLVHSAPCLPQ